MVDPPIPPIPGAACLPGTPGVYRFRDQAGRVLYVGRAVSLGGQKVRAAVSGLGRVLPLAYAAARHYLDQSPPAWAPFAHRNAELAARIRAFPPGTCAG